ncbi:hypothetical protein [Yinghuangia soli]|uniref:Uncharacterized protein n=1 Tax=Yinghuangia soli TaxID=2908204 RepID=A0AA41Q793_9ACTN|nr:hypothetical protein [Yinghuangia soli]MCF2532808.1 hypothetical protein [Yinghuangia soli]
MRAWVSPEPAPVGTDRPAGGEADAPRLPPPRPGPQTRPAPSQRPAPAAAPATAPQTALPANACDGLAQYGIFPVGGADHRWCLAQQRQ